MRRMPTSASIIIEAAANPVSKESWAFHDSTGSISRYSRRQRSSAMSISCAGIGSDTPPRSASLAIRSSPIVRSSASVEPAGAWSIFCWTPA